MWAWFKILVMDGTVSERVIARKVGGLEPEPQPYLPKGLAVDLRLGLGKTTIIKIVEPTSYAGTEIYTVENNPLGSPIGLPSAKHYRLREGRLVEARSGSQIGRLAVARTLFKIKFGRQNQLRPE